MEQILVYQRMYFALNLQEVCHFFIEAVIGARRRQLILHRD